MDYERSRVKQYHKEGRALRTETVINDTYDFDVGRRLKNLDDLKQIGFTANRRLLGVERLSHDGSIGAETLAALHRRALVDGQRASTLRFGDLRVQALLAALLRFDLLPAGFRNREIREAVAPQRGMSLDDYNAGQMTYDLRRLRLPGLIERIPHSQRYRPTAEGLCIGARGKAPAALERRCIPRGLRWSSVEYAQYASSSRLATWAPRRARCHAAFHHGPTGTPAYYRITRPRSPYPYGCTVMVARDFRNVLRQLNNVVAL